MKKLKFLIASLIVTMLFIRCSSDDDSSTESTDEVFIEVNGDLRKPDIISRDYYDVELSRTFFDENSSEPAGAQFVLDIYDPDRQYIGGLGNYEECVEVELFIDYFSAGFPAESKSVETILNAYSASKEEKTGKCEIFIRLKNLSDNVILAGTAIDNQFAEYTLEPGADGFSSFYFKDLIFISTSGNEFEASGRIIVQ